MNLLWDLDFEFDYEDKSKQLRKIKEEIGELEHEIIKAKYLDTGVINTIAEAFDVIEATFTLLKNICFDDELEYFYEKHREKIRTKLLGTSD